MAAHQVHTLKLTVRVRPLQAASEINSPPEYLCKSRSVRERLLSCKGSVYIYASEKMSEVRQVLSDEWQEPL